MALHRIHVIQVSNLSTIEQKRFIVSSETVLLNQPANKRQFSNLTAAISIN